MDNVGRVGRLCNLTLKPELNGTYVVLESYNADKDRFEAKTLRSPNSGMGSVSILVKIANVTFPNTTTFAFKYPNACVHPGNHLGSKYPPGVILNYVDEMREDQSAVELAEGEPTEALDFSDSCRVLGGTDSEKRPATPFLNKTIIDPTDQNACVEFENINFVHGYVLCAGGETITFRNCRFGGDVGLVAGYKLGGRPTRVFVENCVFEGKQMMRIGVYALIECKVVLLNCMFRNCQIGVNVDEGASAVVAHCTFIDCVDGIEMLAKANTLDAINCSFERGLKAFTQRNGGEARVQGCRMEACNVTAFMVEGPKRTVLHIDDCVVTDCRMGVSASMGKIELTMVSTVVTKCEEYGAFFSQNLLGSVNVANCTITGNKAVDVMNFCGPQCPVTIDGVVEKTDDASMCARRAVLDPIWEEMQNSLKRKMTGQSKLFEKRSSLERLRTHKLSGLGYVECSNCKCREPMDEKFKACSKCKNVAYCSRECQVAHWKEHKKECGVVEYC